MKISQTLPRWSIAAPIISWLLLAGLAAGAGDAFGIYYTVLLVAGLLGGVLAAVFHAEIVAHKVGEPYGTLVLALAVTAIVNWSCCACERFVKVLRALMVATANRPLVCMAFPQRWRPWRQFRC